MVNSIIGIPPAQTAWAASIAFSGEEARTTGTIPTSTIRQAASALSDDPRVSDNPRARALHDREHFGEGGHRSVAGRGHRERPMRRAALHRPLRRLARQKSVYQTGREGIAAAYAIVDFQIFAVRGFMDDTICVADAAPIVAAPRSSLAANCSRQSGTGTRELCFRFSPDAESHGEILLIAEHHIHHRGQTPIDLRARSCPPIAFHNDGR